MRTHAALALAALAGLAAAAPAIDHTEKRWFLDAEFDYVIVGGGTGGLAMAARLSEDASVKVAVIEAGTYYQISNIIFSDTPAADVLFTGADIKRENQPFVDWGFVTTPQEGAAGREVHYARGKCLGGSSARNFMIYQRPDRGSLQQWADATGDSSYTWDAWKPYYVKSCKFTPPKRPPRYANASDLEAWNLADFDPAGGPLNVAYPNYASPWTTWWARGLAAIGVPRSKDNFGGGVLEGGTWASTTINPDKQKRDSSETSFWNQAKYRSNVRLYSLTMAKQIVFDANKRATGVKISSGATLKARKEVILSAGAFQSPQLLMVSGVGPADVLQRYNIPVVADRPGVGQNLTDHVFFAPTYRVNLSTYSKLANSVVELLYQFGVYALKKEGPLTDNVANYIAWDRVAPELLSPDVAAVMAQVPPEWPHIEYMSAPGYVGQFNSLFNDQPKDGYQYASVLAALVAPMSRGTVSISSADTKDHPIIDPKWLTHPVDAAIAVEAFKRTRKIFTSDEVRPILADPVEYYPGPNVQSDEQILANIRKSVMTVWHAACSCRMGRVEDPTAVVDSKARVIGVSGLRVVDASAFALLPPGHPTSVVYALAEKIAADIRAGN